EFEGLLVRSGLALRKYYLDITREEQQKRLADRQKDALKAWKTSPVDAQALKKWKPYTKARDEMFRRTSHGLAPWRVVKANHKKRARLGLMSDVLDSFDYRGKKAALVEPDHDVVFIWSPGIEKTGLAR